MSQKASHFDPRPNDPPLLGAEMERMGRGGAVTHPSESLDRSVAREYGLDCVARCIFKQSGWLGAPLLIIPALVPFFVMSLVLCGLFIGFNERIASLDPTTTSVEGMPESLRTAVTAPNSVTRWLILGWLSALSTLIECLPTVAVVLCSYLTKICLLHSLYPIQTRIRRGRHDEPMWNLQGIPPRGVT
jgi:hypothetical protein